MFWRTCMHPTKGRTSSVASLAALTARHFGMTSSASATSAMASCSLLPSVVRKVLQVDAQCCLHSSTACKQ